MGKTDKILELFKIEKDSLVNELTKPPKIPHFHLG